MALADNVEPRGTVTEAVAGGAVVECGAVTGSADLQWQEAEIGEPSKFGLMVGLLRQEDQLMLWGVVVLLQCQLGT